MVDNDPLTEGYRGKGIIVYHARHREYLIKPISHRYSMDIFFSTQFIVQKYKLLFSVSTYVLECRACHSLDKTGRDQAYFIYQAHRPSC